MGKRSNERSPKADFAVALEVEGEDEPGHKIAAADEPQGEHAREEERLGADHADLFEAGFHAEGAHGHGEHEDIQRIDDADGLLGDDAERVDADARDEQDGEPRETAEIVGAVGGTRLSSSAFSGKRFSQKPRQMSRGAIMITRSILTMTAVLPASMEMACPAATACATSCRVPPTNMP